MHRPYKSDPEHGGVMGLINKHASHPYLLMQQNLWLTRVSYGHVNIG
jgi:hypothetical protein